MLPFWKIVGWFFFVVLYMVAAEGMYHWPERNLTAIALKVLPIVQCLFIVLSSKSIHEEYPSFRQNMAYGLVLSMIGDSFLVFEEYTSYGGLAFGLAHIMYLQSLGFSPFGSGPVLASFLVIGACIVYYLLPFVQGVVAVLMFVYLGVLLTVAWRATVRYCVGPNTVNLCGAVGALLFVLSDTILLSDMLGKKWEHAHFVVMATYYTAQLGLAMLATNDFYPTGYENKHFPVNEVQQ